MLQRGLIFVIPNALAKSLMGFGDDQGGNVQKLVTSADCAHLSSNAVWYTDCLKTTNEETSEDENENYPGQKLRMEKRVIPRRLKDWKITRWDEFKARHGWDLFKIENGHNILVEAIVEEIAIKGKGVIQKKFKAIFIDDFVKMFEKFTKAKIPTVSTGLQKYFVEPIFNFAFRFIKIGVKLFFFKGLKNGEKKDDHKGLLALTSWNGELRTQVIMKLENLGYQIIKKIYPPAFNLAESFPDKVIALFVEKVGPVKYFLKKIALSLKYKKIDDTCANSGKDQCASPTPVCEWNPKTDKCGIRESLLLEQSKDLLSWVFWNIVFAYFKSFLKWKFDVDAWYDKIPFLPTEKETKEVTKKVTMQLAGCLLVLEFLSPLFAESKKTKGTAEEKSEEKPEEKSTEEPEEEPEELPKGTPKEKTEEKPEE